MDVIREAVIRVGIEQAPSKLKSPDTTEATTKIKEFEHRLDQTVSKTKEISSQLTTTIKNMTVAYKDQEVTASSYIRVLDQEKDSVDSLTGSYNKLRNAKDGASTNKVDPLKFDRGKFAKDLFDDIKRQARQGLPQGTPGQPGVPGPTVPPIPAGGGAATAVKVAGGIAGIIALIPVIDKVLKKGQQFQEWAGGPPKSPWQFREDERRRWNQDLATIQGQNRLRDISIGGVVQGAIDMEPGVQQNQEFARLQARFQALENRRAFNLEEIQRDVVREYSEIGIPDHIRNRSRFGQWWETRYGRQDQTLSYAREQQRLTRAELFQRAGAGIEGQVGIDQERLKLQNAIFRSQQDSARIVEKRLEAEKKSLEVKLKESEIEREKLEVQRTRLGLISEEERNRAKIIAERLSAGKDVNIESIREMLSATGFDPEDLPVVKEYLDKHFKATETNSIFALLGRDLDRSIEERKKSAEDMKDKIKQVDQSLLDNQSELTRAMEDHRIIATNLHNRINTLQLALEDLKQRSAQATNGATP